MCDQLTSLNINRVFPMDHIHSISFQNQEKLLRSLLTPSNHTAGKVTKQSGMDPCAETFELTKVRYQHPVTLGMGKY